MLLIIVILNDEMKWNETSEYNDTYEYKSKRLLVCHWIEPTEIIP